MLTLNLADIDGTLQQTPFVGVFGGVVGEFVLFMSALKQLAGQMEQLQQLGEYISQKENLIVLFKDIIGKILAEGSIDVGVDQSVEAALKEKD